MPSIQFVTDMHLEGSNYPLVQNPTADILLVTGDNNVDIERGFEILRRAVPSLPIVYVAGNHDYEGKDVSAAKETLAKTAALYDISWLDNATYETDSMVIIGSSLWPSFRLTPKLEREAMSAAKMLIADFSTIFHEGKCLKPETMQKWHETAVEFIMAELIRHKNKTTVVATHWAPFTQSLSPRFKLDMLSAYFVNDLDFKFGGLADYWFHGHVHDSFAYDWMGTKTFCNPRGYSKTFGLAPNPYFDPTFTTQV